LKKEFSLKGFYHCFMARSVSCVLYIVHCIGCILPKQLRIPCQLRMVLILRSCSKRLVTTPKTVDSVQNIRKTYQMGQFLNDTKVSSYASGNMCRLHVVFMCFQLFGTLLSSEALLAVIYFIAKRQASTGN